MIQTALELIAYLAVLVLGLGLIGMFIGGMIWMGQRDAEEELRQETQGNRKS
tara:strand:+ start:466 stop:621 length:156 start_codon:yes stop_codon:yes gene_type:complete